MRDGHSAGFSSARRGDGPVKPVRTGRRWPTECAFGRIHLHPQPPNVSKFSASGALEYEGSLGTGEFFVRAQGRYKGASSTNAQFFDTPGDAYPIFRNPAFFVADMSAGVEFGGISFGLTVENLFDERYFNDVQEFPNFAGSLNPGEPGNIVIGTLGQVRRVIGSVSFEF